MHIPGYSIEQIIGRGGMATVYRAIQESLQREVALKVMEPEVAVDRNFVARFLREGPTVAKLFHPNIIKVFDTGVHGDYYYLSMEYLSGGTLRHRLLAGLSREDALTIVTVLARALGYAHKQGVIHRDIKPQNILFYDHGVPVLSDFGIAKSQSDLQVGLTHPTTYIGSPRYMSPEQIRGEGLDHRSDLYSLGLVFFEMLTGQRPHDGNDPLSIAQRRIGEPAPPLPAVLAGYQPLMDRLLARNPNKRYPRAEEFVADLERKAKTGGNFAIAVSSPGEETAVHSALDSKTISRSQGSRRGRQRSRGEGSSTFTQRWSRSARFLFGLGAGLGTSALLAAFGVVSLLSRSPPAPAPVAAVAPVPALEAPPGSGPPAAVASSSSQVADSPAPAPAPVLPATAPAPAPIPGPLFVEQQRFRGHRSPVVGVALGRDGRMVSASLDHAVRLWHVADPTPEETLLDHAGRVWSVALSSDGRTMASAGGDAIVRLWDAADGYLSAALYGHDDEVKSLAFSPDGRRLASGSMDGTVRLWSLRAPPGGLPMAADGLVLAGPGGWVLDVAFDGDGAWLAAAASTGDVGLWSVADTTQFQTLAAHRRPVLAVAFAPAGDGLATVAADGAVRLWALVDGRLKSNPVAAWSLGPHWGLDVAFSPDGAWLAVATTQGEVKLWRVADGAALATLVHEGGRPVRSLAFGADSRQLLTGGDGRALHLWRVLAVADLAEAPGDVGGHDPAIQVP
ncbi:MAG: WD40 repeat domain-containing serine/threonine protein kinase [Candidatus Competibacterales bacterium]